MIAGFIEGTQTVAIGRIPQLHAQYLLESVVACANTALIEAQRHGREQFAGLLIRDFRRRLDGDETSRKRDLIARRGGLFIDYVEHAVGAAREGCLARLPDVVDVNAVRDVARRGDAIDTAPPEPH